MIAMMIGREDVVVGMKTSFCNVASEFVIDPRGFV